MTASLAIFTPQAQLDEALSQRLGNVVDMGDFGEVRIFSNRGTHLDASNDESPPHIFAPLPEGVSKSLILKELPSIYPSDFVACWLASILQDMGAGGELYLELPEIKSPPRHKVCDRFLAETLKGCGVERLDNQWVRIKNEGLEPELLQSFQSIYRNFHNGFSFFQSAYAEAFGLEQPLTPQQVSKITGTFIYSLFGVNHKGFIVNCIIEDYLNGKRGLDILDMGGGYGLLAADLAAQGHNVSVTDYCKQHVAIGRRLADACGLGQNLSLNVEKIEDIVLRQEQEKYDIISFFGCLLYADRNVVPDVFKSCMRMLKPGGVLLLHENPKGVIKQGSVDYEKCFTSKELITLLKKHAGIPDLYNVFTGSRINWENQRKFLGLFKVPETDWDELNKRVLMCVVRKPG